MLLVFNLCHITQSLVRPVVVIVISLSLGNKPDFFQVSEDIRIKYCLSITAVKLLYTTILSGLAGLREDMFDAICDTPDIHPLGDELRTVISAMVALIASSIGRSFFLLL